MSPTLMHTSCARQVQTAVLTVGNGKQCDGCTGGYALAYDFSSGEGDGASLHCNAQRRLYFM